MFKLAEVSNLTEFFTLKSHESADMVFSVTGRSGSGRSGSGRSGSGDRGAEDRGAEDWGASCGRSGSGRLGSGLWKIGERKIGERAVEDRGAEDWGAGCGRSGSGRSGSGNLVKKLINLLKNSSIVNLIIKICSCPYCFPTAAQGCQMRLISVKIADF